MCAIAIICVTPDIRVTSSRALSPSVREIASEPGTSSLRRERDVARGPSGANAHRTTRPNDAFQRRDGDTERHLDRDSAGATGCRQVAPEDLSSYAENAL